MICTEHKKGSSIDGPLLMVLPKEEGPCGGGGEVWLSQGRAVQSRVELGVFNICASFPAVFLDI